jgi:hypothetical protein
MHRKTCRWLTALLLTVASAVAADSDVPPLTIQVPGGDKMTVKIPVGWKYSIDRPSAGIPPTVDFSVPNGSHLKITFMADAKGQFTKPDELDKLVTKGNQHYVADSVEKRITLQRLASKSGPGVYSVFTDPKLVGMAKPAAGDWRYVSSGAIAIGRQIVIFSLLSNSTDNDEYRQALDFLSNGISVATDGV